MKSVKKLVVVIVLIVVANLLWGAFTFQTYEDEYAVVREFGKIVKVVDTSGLQVKVPFIQSVRKIKKSKNIYDIPKSEVITSDKKTMIVDAYVLWNVTDAKTFTSALNANIETAKARIDVIVYNAMKNTLSGLSQDVLVSSRDTNIAIETVEVTMEDVEIQDISEDSDTDTKKKEVKQEQDNIIISDMIISAIGDQCEQYGIQITDVKIKVLDLPEENKQAVYNRMITERNNIAAAYKAQGESNAQVIRNTTNKEVAVLLSEADATAAKLVAEGEAEYMKILSDAYNDADKADFYTFSLQLDSLKKSLTHNNTTLILDSNNPVAQIFNGSN